MNGGEVVINAKTFANPRIKKADMNAEVTTEAIEIITMQVDKSLQEKTFEVRPTRQCAVPSAAIVVTRHPHCMQASHASMLLHASLVSRCPLTLFFCPPFLSCRGLDGPADCCQKY